MKSAGPLAWQFLPCQGCVVEVRCAPFPPEARWLSRTGFCRWWRAAMQGILGESASVDAADRDAAAGGRCCRPGERRAAPELILTEATHMPGGLGAGRYHCPSSACGFGPAFGFDPAFEFDPACRFGLLVRGLVPTCRFGLLACGLGPVPGLSLLVRGLDPTCRFDLLVRGLSLLVCGLDPACHLDRLACGLAPTCRCGVSSGFCPACGLDTRCGSRPPHGAYLAGRHRATTPLSAT